MCFGGRKTCEERKLCLKIHLFGFPQRLVTGQSTTAPRKLVSPSTLIGPFEFDRALATWPSNQSWRWNQLASGHCWLPGHKPLRKAEEVNFLRQIFRSSRVFQPPKHTYLEWNLLGFMDLLFILRFGTFLVEEKTICGVRSGQRWMEWSAFLFF